ncbi:hypothetical protein GGI42DRAFT_365683 [Trichoderma sp. SZMC 28013]
MYDHHIRVHAQCGACSFAFIAGEAVVILIKGLDNTITTSSPAITFPESFHCDNNHKNEWIYCRFPDCIDCASSLPTVTVHKECLKHLEQLCTIEDKLRWLWMLATWRSPWNESPPLHLTPSPVVDVGLFMRSAAKACEMPEIKSLPTELAIMIYEQANHHSLRQLFSFWTFARWWNLRYNKRGLIIPIDKIEGWQRGTHPIINEIAESQRDESGEETLILLSIDSQGLRNLKRLQKGDTNNYPSQSGSTVYVLEAAACFSSVQLEYNYPFARLRFAGKLEHFRIWDTPSPPQWEECVIDTNYDYTHAKSHLTTIDTRSSSGITFFVASGFVWAIHTHTNTQPFAEDTFNALNQNMPLVWVYVPLGMKDSISAFSWSRNSLKARFFLRLKLAGELIVGSTSEMKDENLQLIKNLVKDPLTLVYERPDSEAITFVGGHSRHAAPLAEIRDTKPKAEQEDTEAFSTFKFKGHPFKPAYYSSAPLDDVTRTEIFQERGGSTCRGILLEYRNGSRRALGQCKVGIDDIQECIEPMQLCYNNLLVNGTQSVQVCISREILHTHDERGWVCCIMKGVLELWFNNRQEKIKLIN